MSLMQLRIHERINEIGLRLALGAKRFDIVTLFLVESVFYRPNRRQHRCYSWPWISAFNR